MEISKYVGGPLIDFMVDFDKDGEHTYRVFVAKEMDWREIDVSTERYIRYIFHYHNRYDVYISS